MSISSVVIGLREMGAASVRELHFTSANQFYRIYKRHFGHATKTRF